MISNSIEIIKSENQCCLNCKFWHRTTKTFGDCKHNTQHIINMKQNEKCWNYKQKEEINVNK